jgi:hypothetical protein
MLHTNRARIAVAFMIANVLVTFLGGVSQAAECRMVPIKPIQCVRGGVVDRSGGADFKCKGDNPARENGNCQRANRRGRQVFI